MRKQINFTHIHDLNTLSCDNNEVFLSGKNEEGEDVTLVFSAFEILSWFDRQTINFIKEKTIEHINEL
tara:strand:- start:712 stop:915 length:204 start_codon:yes stop_codon:yes gene_type:complete